MAVIVTGGAGFIGSQLIGRLLEATDEVVVCLDNFNDYYSPLQKRRNVEPFLSHPRLRLAEGDFCDAPTVMRLFGENDVSSVVHLGGYGGVEASVAAPLVYQRTNVGGTLVLLEAARKFGVGRFVLASSSTVYGDIAESPFREDGPLGIPLSPYGATKRAAELLALNYHRLHHLPTVCLRLFSVYGPRMRPDLVLSMFSKSLVEGRPIVVYGDGASQRDFTHVSDICDGFLAALNAPDAVGEAINLGNARPVSMNEVIAELQGAFDARVDIIRKPPRLCDMRRTCADLSKAKRILGYHPATEFRAGLRAWAEWVKANGLYASAGASRSNDALLIKPTTSPLG
jgi:UDP-glucuronate 4-epimerase